MKKFELNFNALRNYCDAEDYKGWDPYDGLNSRIWKITPFQNISYFRIVWIQAFKRIPFSIMRRLLLVPKKHNSMAIALFITGYCNYYKKISKTNIPSQELAEIKQKIIYLSNLLVSLRNRKYSGASWGYSFDWQSRAFFLPYDTPTVVATAFCVEALLDAYRAVADDSYKQIACSSVSFVLNDLNRIDKGNGKFMFSYSPLDNRAVYNASLFGSKILAMVYEYTKDPLLRSVGIESAKSVCEQQNFDGSFPHSDQVKDKWRDSFHTAFKLESLQICLLKFDEEAFKTHITRGFEYWKKNFFDCESGFPYYYDRGRNKSLVDLHCVGQALSTFSKLGVFENERELANKIIHWSFDNMWSDSGYFYFQKKKGQINRSVFMRWPNAIMFYGLSFYLLSCDENY